MLHSDPADVTSAVVVMTVMRRTFITANRFRESEQKRQRSSAAASSACRIPSWLLTSQVRLFKALLAISGRLVPHLPAPTAFANRAIPRESGMAITDG